MKIADGLIIEILEEKEPLNAASIAWYLNKSERGHLVDDVQAALDSMEKRSVVEKLETLEGDKHMPSFRLVPRAKPISQAVRTSSPAVIRRV